MRQPNTFIYIFFRDAILNHLIFGVAPLKLCLSDSIVNMQFKEEV